MNKVEETNKLIDYVTKLQTEGVPMENTIFLADIAKSLAIIADKLCDAGDEKENDKI